MDEFELIKLSNSNDNKKLEFAIKFHNSNLSLEKIEDLVYQRDCIKSLVEKTFESLQSMSEKLSQMEKELKFSLTE